MDTTQTKGGVIEATATGFRGVLGNDTIAVSLSSSGRSGGRLKVQLSVVHPGSGRRWALEAYRWLPELGEVTLSWPDWALSAHWKGGLESGSDRKELTWATQAKLGSEARRMIAAYEDEIVGLATSADSLLAAARNRAEHMLNQKLLSVERAEKALAEARENLAAADRAVAKLSTMTGRQYLDALRAEGA